METTRKPRVALYARVSTREQSPDMQLAELRQVADQRGWEIVSQHIDRGWSGKTDRRPGLDALLADAAAAKFDVVAVFKLDRLARSLRHLVEMLDRFQSYGVALVSIHDAGIDATTPSGRLMTHLVAAFAEFERSLIVERVRSGLDNARRRGVKVGRPRAAFDLARARRLHEAGHHFREIARMLNVGPTTIWRALRTPASTVSEPPALPPALAAPEVPVFKQTA